MRSNDRSQAIADTLTGLTGAVMALAAEVCQRDPGLAQSLAITLSGLIENLPENKKASPQATVLRMMQMVAEGREEAPPSR